MGGRVLIASGTKSGSTGEVAEAVARALRERGAKVGVHAARDVAAVRSYNAVVIGSPVLYGKPHADLTRFLKRNEDALSRMPVAAFLTCLEPTNTTEGAGRGIDIYIDPTLARPPAVEGSLSYFERTHLISRFLDGLLDGAPQVKPVSVAFFRGKLAYDKLDWISHLVMRLIWLIYRRAPEGDFRNWQAIRSWATSLAPALLDTEAESER